MSSSTIAGMANSGTVGAGVEVGVGVAVGEVEEVGEAVGVGEVLGLVDGEGEGEAEVDGEGDGDGEGEGVGLGFVEGKLRLGTAWGFAELRIGMKLTLPRLKSFL